MTDLRDRFGELDRLPVPDLDEELRRPRLQTGPVGWRGGRLFTAAVALVVAGVAIAFAIRAFEVDEGAPRPASTVANGQLAFSGDGQIHVVSPDGSGLRQLTHLGGHDALDVHWSPDGSKLAFRVWTNGNYQLFVLNADGTEPTNITGSMGVSELAWSPDGTMLAFTSFHKGNDFDIFVVNADGTGLRPVVESPLSEHRPQWSPDGTRLAFERWPIRDSDPGTAEIYSVELAGGEAVPLVTSPGYDTGVAWSPDGVRIAFTSDQDGDEEIYVVNADGSSQQKLTDLPDAFARRAAWSPDGSRLSFVADDAEQWDIWVVNADGSGLQKLTPSDRDEGPAVWSPDGRLLAFTATDVMDGDNTGTYDVYTIRPDGTDERQITFGQVAMGWDLSWQPLFETAPSPTVTPTPTETPTLRGEIAATLQVGEDVRSVVYGEGSVWVAVSNNDGTFAGRILRIDPATNETIATIPVETIPTWEVGGGAMVVADGSLWVTGGIDAAGGLDSPGGGSDAAVVRIDTSTNTVVDRFTLGGTGGADLTFLDGDLWVLVFGDETVDHSMEIVRVAPPTGEVLARIPLTANWAQTIVAAGGRLLVLEGGSRVVNKGGQITSIDPGTNAVAVSASLHFLYSATGPVVWRDEVWAGVEGGFARFDAATGELVDRSPDLDPARLSLGRMSFEADDTGIWFLGYNGVAGEGPNRLARFDPETDAVIELVILEERNPVAMAVGPDSVWILHYEGTLTRVDLIQD